MWFLSPFVVHLCKASQFQWSISINLIIHPICIHTFIWRLSFQSFCTLLTFLPSWLHINLSIFSINELKNNKLDFSVTDSCVSTIKVYLLLAISDFDPHRKCLIVSLSNNRNAGCEPRTGGTSLEPISLIESSAMGTEIILDGDQTIYLMNWKIDSDFRRFSRIEKKHTKVTFFIASWYWNEGLIKQLEKDQGIKNF